MEGVRFMRIINVAKTGMLLLCILLTLPILTGCANELLENQELVQIAQEWESVIQNENCDIAKIRMTSLVAQSPYSSELSSAQNIILEDEGRIDAMIDILSNQQVVWDSMPKAVDDFFSYQETRYGKREIVLEFYDVEDRYLLRFCVFEDGFCEVYWDVDLISDTQVNLKKSACAVASQDLYRSLEAFLNVK